MTDAGRRSDDTVERLAGAAERGVRGAVLLVVGVGVRRRNPGAVVNAAAGLLWTVLPAAVERRYAVDLRPWQRLYVGVAALAHAVGMLGPYEDVWWWDHFTHTYSATVVGGLVHVVARRRGRDPRPSVLAGVVALGTLWEALEYLVHRLSRRVGLEPLLVPYGPVDTLLDLVFDLLGAALVVLLGDRLLGDLTR